MAGNANSGHVTPRSLRDDARLNLLDARDQLRIAGELHASMSRVLANAYRLTTIATDELDRAMRGELGLPAREVAA